MSKHPLHREICKILFSNNRYKGLVARFLCEFDFAGDFGKNGMIFTHANVFAGVILGTALTDNDIARNNGFATELLNT